MKISTQMEQTDAKSKPKKENKGKDIEPQPGKYPVTQKMVTSPTPGEKITFTHSTEFATELVESISTRIHPFEERYSNDPQTYDAYKHRVKRFVYAMMSKKLANSMSDEQRLSFEGEMRGIAKFPLSSPSAIVQLFDLFGSTDIDGVTCEMIGQPLWCFTYFARAVNADGPDEGDIERIFVNRRWPNARAVLFEYALGVINTWVESTPPHGFNFGDVVVPMGVPRAFRNIAGYSAFTQAIVKPETVVRALMIAQIAEGVGPFTQQQEQELLQRGVKVVDWDSRFIYEKMDAYSRQVESRLRMSMGMSTNWVPVGVFKSSGSPGQLLRRRTENLLVSPYPMSAGQLELGKMASGATTTIAVSHRAHHVLVDHTNQTNVTRFVDSMLKL